MSEPASQDLDLRGYVTILWRRKYIIVAVAAGVVAMSLGLALAQSPSYRASSDLLLRFRPSPSLLEDTAQKSTAERSLNNEVRLLESRPVREAAQRTYKGALDVERVTASIPSADSDIIRVTVAAGDRSAAAELVNSYVDAYIKVRRDQTVQELLSVGDEVRSKINEIEKRIAALPSTGAQAQLAPLQSQLNFYQQQLDALQLSVGISESGTVQILDPAEPPSGPFAPKPERSGVLGAILGLILGVGLAFVREHFDDSVTTKEDVVKVAPTLPVMGLIPAQSDWKDRSLAALITRDQLQSPAAEAYRTLRTSLKFRGLEGRLRLLQVTSPSATEGKTTTLANLAVAFADAGDNVAVVCCDLRRPRVHEFFGLDNQVGLTTVLLGDVTLESALQPVPGVRRLTVLASGQSPPNPAELLGTARAAELFKALATSFDLVLVDCPPVLPVADASILASRMDGLLLVANAGTTSRPALGAAIERLRQVEAPILGVVLNGVATDEAYGYGGYYGYKPDSPTDGKGIRRLARTKRSLRSQHSLD